VSRIRGASKAPVAIGAILATPLFFVALLSLSLKLDKPSVRLTKSGARMLTDPAKSTVGTIYLLAFAISMTIVLVGVLSLFARSRLAVIAPAVVTIFATVSLLLPLSSWEKDHTARYPLGVDFIKQSASDDLILRGEWEDNAHRAARQIGTWTIVISIVAIVVAVVFDLRRRRGLVGPPVPPPPDVVTGEAQMAAGGLGRPRDQPRSV
jgi:hypothetical protein